MKKINSNVANTALRWLQYSDKDLTVAAYLMNAEPISPAHICLLCQQAAEKAIKAALTLEKIHFPRTHDLDTLRDMLPDTWSVKTKHPTLSDMAEWNINAKYPGDWPEPTIEDAVRAMSIARSVCNLVTVEFKNRGILVET